MISHLFGRSVCAYCSREGVVGTAHAAAAAATMPSRLVWYQVAAFGLTFTAYVLLHATRKSFSVAKAPLQVRHRVLCCSRCYFLLALRVSFLPPCALLMAG